MLKGEERKIPMHILFAGKSFLRLWDLLLPAFQGHEMDVADDLDLKDKLPWADVLIIRVTYELHSKDPRLKMVQQWGVGVEGLDIEACTKLGIFACNIPSRGTGNAEGVAEIALLHMMLLARRYARSQEKISEGKIFTPPGITLWGKRACVVGLGNLGHCVVERLIALGMSVVGVNRTYRPEFREWGIKSFYSLAEMEKALPGYHFVVVTLGLTPETQNSIAEPFFHAMDRNAFFINVARGGLVIREAFEKAIEEEWIAGAGLDVFWTEPPLVTDPILHHPRITVTPHIGGVTDASLKGALHFVAGNVEKLTKGEIPLSCLNRETFLTKEGVAETDEL